MNLKKIIDEELGEDDIQKTIAQLNIGIANFNKKIASNPVLSQSVGQDINGISKLSADVQKQILDLNKKRQVQQQMQVQQKAQQQKLQQQKMQQNQKKVTTANGDVNISKNIVGSYPNTANN